MVGGGGLLDALANAMADRRQNMNDGERASYVESDDSDWDD